MFITKNAMECLPYLVRVSVFWDDQRVLVVKAMEPKRRFRLRVYEEVAQNGTNGTRLREAGFESETGYCHIPPFYHHTMFKAWGIQFPIKEKKEFELLHAEYAARRVRNLRRGLATSDRL